MSKEIKLSTEEIRTNVDLMLEKGIRERHQYELYMDYIGELDRRKKQDIIDFKVVCDETNNPPKPKEGLGNNQLLCSKGNVMIDISEERDKLKKAYYAMKEDKESRWDISKIDKEFKEYEEHCKMLEKEEKDKSLPKPGDYLKINTVVQVDIVNNEGFFDVNGKFYYFDNSKNNFNRKWENL